ncbi:hypothetical protein D3C83_00760 [compost metagenome]
MRAVSPGANDVDETVGILDRDLGGEITHHFRRCGDFPDGFLLDSQADDDRRDQRGRDLPAHDGAHDAEHLLPENLAVLDHAPQRFLWSHDFVPLRKFCSSWWPCSVRMDSG